LLPIDGRDTKISDNSAPRSNAKRLDAPGTVA
jgi:hypothetical protein